VDGVHHGSYGGRAANPSSSGTDRGPGVILLGHPQQGRHPTTPLPKEPAFGGPVQPSEAIQCVGCWRGTVAGVKLPARLFNGSRSMLIVGVLAVAACAESGTDVATPGSVTTTPSPSITVPSTTETPTTESSTEASSVPAVTTPILAVDWKTPPVFAVPGQQLVLTFSLSTDPILDDMAAAMPAPDEVAVVVAGIDAPLTAPAVLDEVSATWTSTVQLADDVNGDHIDVLALFGESATSEVLRIPLVTDQSVIEPSFVDLGPTVVAELGWGDGDGQVGRLDTDGSETLVPQSVDVNQIDGSIVVLDTVNERLVVVEPSTGETRSIPLPVRDGWFVQDVIVMGTTDRAAVVTYPAAGDPRIGVFDVNLSSGLVDDSNDPMSTTEFPSNVPMFWNPFERTLTARVIGQDSPFYAADTSTFLPELEPRVWFDVARVESPGAVGITDGGVDVFTAIPGGAPTIVDSRINEDGSFWQIAQTVDFGVEPPVVASVLLFTQPAAHRSLASDVETENRYSYSRLLAVDGEVAYIAVPADSGFRIDRYSAD